MKTLLKTSNKVRKSISVSSHRISSRWASLSLEQISTKCKWYCLLPESIGRHKRMAAAMPVEPLASHSHKKSRRNPSNGILYNVRTNDVASPFERRTFFVQVEIYHRDEIRFTSAYPCTVSEVKSSSISSSTRPMPGDVLVQGNEINVARPQPKAVEKVIKYVCHEKKRLDRISSSFRRTLPLPITFQLYRRSVSSSSSSSVKLDKIVLNSVEQHQPLNSDLLFCKTSEKNFSFSETYADQAFCSSDKPMNEYEALTPCLLPETILLHPSPVNEDQSLLISPIRRKRSDQSDGSESGVGSESNAFSDGEHRLISSDVSQSYERDALRLIEMEKEFISKLELGVQFYSRPLKHYLISANEHAKLFQNIEKVISNCRKIFSTFAFSPS